MYVINYKSIIYMNKMNNNVTANVALSSQIRSFFCDVIVTQNDVTTMNISNMNVTLKNMRSMAAFIVKMKRPAIALFLNSFILSLKKVFVRSLFAHCTLMVRFIGEETAFMMNSNSNLINSKIYYYGTF